MAEKIVGNERKPEISFFVIIVITVMMNDKSIILDQKCTQINGDFVLFRFLSGQVDSCIPMVHLCIV